MSFCSCLSVFVCLLLCYLRNCEYFNDMRRRMVDWLPVRFFRTLIYCIYLDEEI